MTDKQLLDLHGRNPREPFTGICTDLRTSEPRVYCETATLDQAKRLGKELSEVRIYKHTPNSKLAHWDLAYDVKEDDYEKDGDPFEFDCSDGGEEV